MANTSTYLNFSNNTEEAFNFYKSIFGGEFLGEIFRFKDIPKQDGEGISQISKENDNLVIHIALPILGGHILMGTDAPESMGFKIRSGNNMHISLHPDTREEADRLFAGLSINGVVDKPMQDMFWGAYYGDFTDQYGINWMINCEQK